MKAIDRLFKYLDFKGFKPAPFEREIGLSNGYLGKQKGRNADLGESIILKIIENCPDLSLNWLVANKGEMIISDNAVGNEVKEDESEYRLFRHTPQVITITPNNEDNIVLVDVKAQAGYLNGFNDPLYLKKLPTYNLPNLRNGIFRMFQLEGHSMYPTMHSNSFAVGQFVENWITDIKDNKIYIIVSDNDGVVIKRVLNRIDKYGSLYCKSDNRKEYPSFSVDIKDIKEVWEVKLLLSYNFLDPAEIYDRVSDLEAEILHIKDLYRTKT